MNIKSLQKQIAMNQNAQFEHQAKAAAAALVNILTAITPLFLVVAILGVATVNGYLEYIHYSVVIGSAAWVPGFIFASIRFGSGLGGIHLFKQGETMRGLFFLLVSVGLTFWTSSHAGSMAVSIALSSGQEDNARVLIQTALWVALIGEVMIATYMGAHHSETPATAQRETPETQPYRNGATPPQQVVAQPRATVTTPPQRIGNNGNTTPGINNSATIETGQPQRREIGFRQPERNAVSNSLQAVQPAPAATFRNDGVLLSEQLETARGNLRAYRSKLRAGKGNTETLQRGVTKWESIVADLEAQLQNATE